MTERITSQMLDNMTVENIDDDLNQMDKTQAELSTGYTINEPSDDPYGAALSISLNAQISAYSSYTANISSATSWSDTASASLQSIESTLEDVRDLTVEGANGTMSTSDLQNAAEEVLQYIGQIKSDADAQYDGSYVFSGTATTTEPWDPSDTGSDTYSGNDDSTNYLIGPSTTLAVGADLNGVLGSGTGSAGTYDSTTGEGGLLTTLRQVYTDMENGDTTALSSDLTSLDDNKDQLEELQSSVGATQDRLQLASTFITSLSEATTSQLGNVEDTDVAQATIDFSTEENAYEAALKSSSDIIQTSLMDFLDT
jgi:flagellar hook-associated protein 3 FlgL